jgi:hypothetical protein
MAYIVDNVTGTEAATQATVLYVDSINGDDGNVGSSGSPKKTIKGAVASANAGYVIRVAAGVYAETIPISITVENLSIVGASQRSCFIHPTTATQYNTMFLCNSGTYIDGFTFAGLKASGTRGAQPTNGTNPDTDPTYGLPPYQGWVAGFLSGCSIKKSPYINNCSNFADSGIDNDNFDPNNYAGTGGDTSSAPAGGGVIVDGSLPAVNSPLRSFVINEFTQICLDGPGLLVCNNGYAQAVSFFGLFCHYHAKALSGGQINMEVGTTDFGRYGLIADGKSSAAIFTALSVGTASTGNTTFVIGAPTAALTWFGDQTRPALNMLVQIGANIYPILSSTANGAGWTVQISRPNPLNYLENLGLIAGFSAGTTVSFFLRSMVSTASHTMEYAGSGCNYNALPENGGVPVEANEAINLNNGKVWLTSTDQNGKFKVGTTFSVDQQTGYVKIDPNGVSTNVSSDPSPALGGDLDLRNHKIYTSYGNSNITIEANGTGTIILNGPVSMPGAGASGVFAIANGTASVPSLTFAADVNTGLYRVSAETLGFTTNGTAKATIDDTTAPIKEIYSSVYYPIATQVDVGTDPNQVPLNQYLGTLAFQDSIATQVDVQVFTTSGTWTKPAGVSQVRVVAIGGGGGGGSGCKGAAATNRNGGVGGQKGNYFDTTLRASDLTSTVSVTVGSGGTGGGSQTTNTTSGNAGAAGGNTTFGSYLTSYGGVGGTGGTVANSTVAVPLERITTELNYMYKVNSAGTPAISVGANIMFTLGGCQASAAFSYGGMYGNFGPGGGGGGGPISSANSIATSLGYGGSGSMLAVVCPGGTPTLTDGSTGGTGTNAAANQPYGGGGGSGGQSSLVGNAGAGGAGGLYGGGGGGGGASVDSVGNSGTGGAGAAGICVVISW